MAKFIAACVFTFLSGLACADDAADSLTKCHVDSVDSECRVDSATEGGKVSDKIAMLQSGVQSRRHGEATMEHMEKVGDNLHKPVPQATMSEAFCTDYATNNAPDACDLDGLSSDGQEFDCKRREWDTCYDLANSADVKRFAETACYSALHKICGTMGVDMESCIAAGAYVYSGTGGGKGKGAALRKSGTGKGGKGWETEAGEEGDDRHDEEVLSGSRRCKVCDSWREACEPASKGGKGHLGKDIAKAMTKKGAMALTEQNRSQNGQRAGIKPRCACGMLDCTDAETVEDCTSDLGSSFGCTWDDEAGCVDPTSLATVTADKADSVDESMVRKSVEC